MEYSTYQDKVIAQQSLYIRRVPTTSGDVAIGGLTYRSWVEADRKQGTWCPLTRINGARRRLSVDT